MGEDRHLITDEPEKYGALSIDTQTIQKEGFRFDRGALSLLKQFRGSSIQVVLTSIVVNETTSHLEEAIRAARSSLRKAVTDADRLLPPLPSLIATEDLDKIEPREAAAAKFNAYLKSVEAEVIGADQASLADIERRYFQTLPPFAGIRDKKHEFPDAIALSALENWAKANGKRVLAVSEDKGWSSYGSDLIRVVASISEALGILQEDPEHRANLFVKARLAELPLQKLHLHAAEFARLLEEAVSAIDFDITAESDMNFEIYYPVVKLKGYTFSDNFTLVKISDDEIVAELEATLIVEVLAEVSFSVHDSIDKDEVPMGELVATREHEIDDLQLLVTFVGDFSAEDWEISEVEISTISKTIDIGYVEPDWRNQKPEEE